MRRTERFYEIATVRHFNENLRPDPANFYSRFLVGRGVGASTRVSCEKVKVPAHIIGRTEDTPSARHKRTYGHVIATVA
jgi:hypothetical protein